MESAQQQAQRDLTLTMNAITAGHIPVPFTQYRIDDDALVVLIPTHPDTSPAEG